MLIRVTAVLALFLGVSGCGPTPYLLALFAGSSSSHHSAPNAPPTLSVATPVRAQVANRVEIDFGDGKGGFRQGPKYDFGIDWGTGAQAILVGDIDGDATDDLIVISGETILTLFGDGRGGFRRADPEPFPGAPSPPPPPPPPPR